jgi:hypothetical protein
MLRALAHAQNVKFRDIQAHDSHNFLEPSSDVMSSLTLGGVQVFGVFFGKRRVSSGDSREWW